jgi:RNA polymerase-binding transcription factor DksA
MKIKDNPTLIRDIESEAVLGDSQSYDNFIKKAKNKKKEKRILNNILLEMREIKQRLSKLEEKVYG